MRNNEGFWKLSPSKLYSFVDCPSCFWAENHIGSHPFTLPLRLNDAMDSRLKSRYDLFRAKGGLPPELAAEVKGIRLFPDLVQLEEWRNNKTALRYIDEKLGYVLDGKIDELFLGKNNEFIPADYKSSGDPPKEDKQKYYRLQLAAYAWMFANRGYEVGNKAYLLHYYTKDREDPSMSMDLNFHADEVAIDLAEFPKKMKEMIDLLNGPFPGPNNFCKRCEWLEKRKIVE
ncbi:MAG: PD-(D/E)XK nuclease family protein [Candidatus Harrisonbacteria bacterium]|nr:PD-(D/E)XK nuclease family protein [Candidatus Harrisonbacteria bacterium]